MPKFGFHFLNPICEDQWIETRCWEANSLYWVIFINQNCLVVEILYLIYNIFFHRVECVLVFTVWLKNNLHNNTLNIERFHMADLRFICHIWYFLSTCSKTKTKIFFLCVFGELKIIQIFSCLWGRLTNSVVSPSINDTISTRWEICCLLYAWFFLIFHFSSLY